MKQLNKENKMFKRVLLLIGTILLFFIVAEGVTRIVMPNSVKRRLMHQPDERLGFRLAPNYVTNFKTSSYKTIVKINSNGLRDHEHKIEKDSSTYRILVMGDSQIFGLGVDIMKSYPKVLETILNENKDENKVSKYEVVNAGVDGYGTEQEYLYLKELGPIFKPDLVIVGLTANDIEEVRTGIPSFAKNWLTNHFCFFAYLKGQHIKFKKRVKKRSTKLPENFFQIYQDNYPTPYENALKRTKNLLLQMHRYSTSIGSKMLIIIIPQSFELGRSEWKKMGLESLYNEDFFNNNMDKFSRIFTEFGGTQGIPTLSLLHEFRESIVYPLYLSDDPHWTKEGHRLAAENTYKFLKENGFIY